MYILAGSVLDYGTDHINNLKVKYFKVLIIYHFMSKTFKVFQRKCNLLRISLGCLKIVGRFFFNVWGCGMPVAKNEYVQEAG